jgi:ribose 5-phosphate isomerase B
MKIALGADHAGFELKDKIEQYLEQKGISVQDHGTNSADSVDYPDYARQVAEDVIEKRVDYGILVCGTGIGMSIAANKVPGIRAANARNEADAQLSREHNDANILTLGARVLDEKEAVKIVERWLKTTFLGGRHGRRVEKISEIERTEVSK